MNTKNHRQVIKDLNKNAHLVTKSEVIRVSHQEPTTIHLSTLPLKDPNYSGVVFERSRPCPHKQCDSNSLCYTMGIVGIFFIQAHITIPSRFAPHQIINLQPLLARHPTLVMPHHHSLLKTNGPPFLHVIKHLDTRGPTESSLHQAPQPDSNPCPNLPPVVQNPPVGDSTRTLYVPRDEGHDSGQAVPDVVVVVVVVRHERQAFHERRVVGESFWEGEGVGVPGAVVVVAAFDAEEPPMGGGRGELLVLDPALLVLLVVHGAHEPRVALEGSRARVA